jgi:hypothetical protein
MSPTCIPYPTNDPLPYVDMVPMFAAGAALFLVAAMIAVGIIAIAPPAFIEAISLYTVGP